MRIYTTKEAAEVLQVSVRTIQNYCGISTVGKVKGKYQITKDHLNEWETFTKNEKETQKEVEKEIKRVEELKEDTITETFTTEEYDKLTEVIHTHKLLLERIEDYRNEIAYLRKSLDNKNEQMAILLENVNKSLQAIQQTNYISAKDKGYNPE